MGVQKSAKKRVILMLSHDELVLAVGVIQRTDMTREVTICLPTHPYRSARLSGNSKIEGMTAL